VQKKMKKMLSSHLVARQVEFYILLRNRHHRLVPITMEALCFQERNIMNTFSVDYHERGTDYQTSSFAYRTVVIYSYIAGCM
jgi:hypothetical protein